MKITIINEKDANLRLDLEGDISEKTVYHNMSQVRTLAGVLHVFKSGSYDTYTLNIPKLHIKNKKILKAILNNKLSISTNNGENFIGLVLTSTEIEWVRVNEEFCSCNLTFANKVFDINM